LEIQSRTRANGNVVMPDDETPKLAMMKWFNDQAAGGVQQVFAPFLDFKRWR
jgi:hypothetical protein